MAGAQYQDWVSSTPEVIRAYRPQVVTPGEWEVHGPLVREAVRSLDPPTPDRAREWMRTLASILVWAVEQGYPADLEAVLHPDTVERWVAVSGHGLKETSLATRRSTLRRMGRQLTTKAPWEPPNVQLPKGQRHAPYSPREIDLLRGTIQRTPLFRRRWQGILALGLGAGVVGREAFHATPEDLRLRHGVTVLRIQGHRGRDIPVRSEYAEDLRRAAREHPVSNFLAAELKEWDRSRSWHLKQHLQYPPDIPLENERLRATWLVHHLDNGVPIQALLTAAGVKSFEPLDRLRGYLVERVVSC